MRITESKLRMIIREALEQKKLSELMSFPGDSDYDDNIVTFSRSHMQDNHCAVCGDETSPEELAMNKGVCDYCSRTPHEDDDGPQVNIDTH